MIAQERIICKIRYAPGQTTHIIEIIGEVDEKQLKSQDCKAIIVKNRQYLNNEYPPYKLLIDKKEIVEIIIFQEKKRLIINKQNFALNPNIIQFTGVKT